MDWNKRIKKLGSKTDTGQAIHDRWPPDDPRLEKLKPGSIATMVGKLASGDDSWWRKPENGPARTALAELLDEDEFDLFPNIGKEHLSAWASQEFNALRPYDPELGPPIDVSLMQCGTWHPRLTQPLIHAVTRIHDIPAWLQVPEGCGKSFALRWARLQGLYVVSGATLADVVGQIQRVPVIVDIERPDPDSDLAASERLLKLRQVLVVAPFKRPRTSSAIDDDSPFESASTLNDVLAVSKLTDFKSQWTDWRWVADAALRHRLVLWASARAPAGSMLQGQAENVIAWLDQLDPDVSQFGRPADVLWLLERIHEGNLAAVRRAGLGGLAETLFQQRAERAHATDPALAIWLIEEGLAVVLGMCARRLADLTLSLVGPLHRDQWNALVPDYACSPGDVQRLREELNANPANVEQAIARFDLPRRQVVVERLVRARILLPETTDELNLGPPWLATFGLSRAAKETVAMPGALHWGRMCYDSARRSFIDEDLLKLASEKQAEKHLACLPERPKTPAEMAAVDAWFVAVGTLCMEDKTPACAMALLHRLATAELNGLVFFYRGSTWPMPLSRLRDDGARESLHLWMAAAWAWSLAMPTPAELPTWATWLVPGWTKPKLRTIPRDLPLHGEHGVRFINWLAKLVIETPNDTPAEAMACDAWTAWVLARLYLGQDIDATPERLAWNRELVANSVLGWDDPRRTTAAGILAKTLFLGGKHVAKELADWSNDQRKPFQDLALQILTTDDLVDGVRRPGGYVTGDLEHLLKRLPGRFQLPLLEAINIIAVGDIKNVCSLADRELAISPDALEWLALHKDAHWPLARSWAKRLPHRAFAWLKRTGLIHPLSQHVLPALSRELIDDVLDWAEALPVDDSAWLVHWWCMHAMSQRPDLVDRLWALRMKLDSAAALHSSV